MNKIEKKVYDLLKAMPWLKYLIRNIYQSIFDLLPRQKEYYSTPVEYKEGFYWGFHDITPFSHDESLILANKLEIPLRMPKVGDILTIGAFDFDGSRIGNFKTLDSTLTWNYHKGCRLQWLDQDHIIFNTLDKGKLASKIIQIKSGESKMIDSPIDSTAKNGKMASTFSYERLEQFMPGYGYLYKDDARLELKHPDSTGIFLIDLENNEKKLVLSLDALSKLEFNEEGDYSHFVTHSSFSLDNRYLSFLHRWVGKDIKKLNTRLVIHDLIGKKNFILPTDGMVSHYVWNQDNEIIAYSCVNGLDTHVLFSVNEQGVKYTLIDPKKLNSDGHQSFINTNSFITDTYPDKYRMANIYRVDISEKKVERLARVYSPKKFQTRNIYKHIACDLHPRVSPKGNFISFDSVSSGNRSLCIMKLNQH